MRNDIVSSLALKRMCCILLRTWTEQWLNIRRHIGTKSTTSEASKMKEQTRWKEEKRKLTACENRKKNMPYFPFPGRSPPCRGLWAGHIWYSKTRNSWLWNPTHVYLKDRQGMLARPLQGKLFRQGSPLRRLSGNSAHEGRMNLQLSYRTVSKYKWFVWDKLCF